MIARRSGIIAGATALTLLVVGAVGYSVHERRELASEMAAMRGEVGSLRAQLRAARDQQVRGDVLAATAAQGARHGWHTAEPEPAPVPVASPEASSREADAAPVSAQERVAYLEAVLESEPVDRGWSAPSAAKLHAGLTRIAPDARGLGQVECRNTLCRARYEDGDLAACERFIERSVSQEPPYFWEGAYTVVRDEPGSDGRCGVSLVFAREQTELPTVD